MASLVALLYEKGGKETSIGVASRDRYLGATLWDGTDFEILSCVKCGWSLFAFFDTGGDMAGCDMIHTYIHTVVQYTIHGGSHSPFAKATILLSRRSQSKSLLTSRLPSSVLRQDSQREAFELWTTSPHLSSDFCYDPVMARHREDSSGRHYWSDGDMRHVTANGNVQIEIVTSGQAVSLSVFFDALICDFNTHIQSFVKAVFQRS